MGVRGRRLVSGLRDQAFFWKGMIVRMEIRMGKLEVEIQSVLESLDRLLRPSFGPLNNRMLPLGPVALPVIGTALEVRPM